MLDTVAFAASVSPTDSVGVIAQDGLNELSVRNAVTRYFEDRANYLRGDVNDFISAVPAMVSDENAHRNNLQENNIVFLNSEVSIDVVNCYDVCAEITATETITYTAGDKTCYEVVTHLITVYLDENEKPIVASDEYHEKCSDFYSCSFVFPAEDILQPMAAGGSKLCIINAAEAEVGYAEYGTNITKYGEWYGNHCEWCAIFVSWCANRANISTSIIPKEAHVPAVRNFYVQRGRYYSSPNQGGTTAPQVGDLFFEGSSASDVEHVGIITAVDSDNIYVIDGNCDNQVKSHSISRTSNRFVGFARPQYASSSHSAGSLWYRNSTHHWHECANCGETMTKAAHTPGSTWYRNSTHHWHECASCGEEMTKKAHTFYLSGGYYTCSVCGYKTTQIVDINGDNLLYEPDKKIDFLVI